jgi:hypothetical protein
MRKYNVPSSKAKNNLKCFGKAKQSFKTFSTTLTFFMSCKSNHLV